MYDIFNFTVNENEKGMRLDKFVFSKLPFSSRAYLVLMISEGFCLVNGQPKPGGHKITAGDNIVLEVEVSKFTSIQPDEIELNILFEDDEIIVVDKPSEMLVHPSRFIRQGTLLNALNHHLHQQNKKFRAGLPHRLDKQTSGLIVISKTERALRILATHFQRKLVKKTYLALVEGIVRQEKGEIIAPVGRVEDGIPRWQVVETGKPSHTIFSVIDKNTQFSLLEMEPVTGRTNQLRVHAAHIGHPIVGDTKRGGRAYQRLCLHAAKLGFFHPNGGWLEFQSEIPPDIKDLVN
jgi:23S rRNA pseudouridine1911/1915/1917 synthase